MVEVGEMVVVRWRSLVSAGEVEVGEVGEVLG